MLGRNGMSIAPAHSARRGQTTTAEALAAFLKAGVGQFPEILRTGRTHFLRTFTPGVALSAAFDLALALLQAVSDQ
jgi:hypothetical protein